MKTLQQTLNENLFEGAVESSIKRFEKEALKLTSSIATNFDDNAYKNGSDMDPKLLKIIKTLDPVIIDGMSASDSVQVYLSNELDRIKSELERVNKAINKAI